jgi:hypothetical protein
MLFFVAALSLWLVANTSGTWGYFSNTLQELATISTGFWEDLPGQSGTSIKASKTASGYWEMVGGEHKIGVRGEVCVTNSGERPTENLLILDVVQVKLSATKFEDYFPAYEIDLGSHPVLAPGESQCYPYGFEILPVAGMKFRNVAYVSVTNHSGWIPGGHNCPGPERCPFGPAPKAGFEIPLPPEAGDDNISPPDRNLPDTGSPMDGEAEGKLIELPAPPDSPLPGEPGLPTPTNAPTQPPVQETEPTPEEKIALPTPTPAPTQDVSLIPTYPPVEDLNPTPTLAPTDYSGPTDCTQPVAYWLEHPGKWQHDQFLLGEMELDHNQALEILATNPQGDASKVLAQQYIAALLNIASPADPTLITEALDQAAAWFVVNPPGSQPKNPERKAGLQLAETMEAYNLGDTGPGSCVSELPAPTPTAAYTPTSTSPPTPTLAPTMAPTQDPTLATMPTPAATQMPPTPASTP